MKEITCKRLVITSYKYIPKREILPFQISLLRDILSVRSRFDSAAEMIEMFDDSKPGWFGIPLHHPIRIQAEEVVDHRVLGNKPLTFWFTSQLRPGQVPVLQKFEQQLELGKTGFVIEAKPGFGKTVTAIKMIQIIAKPTLVIVPRSNLVDQWVQRFVDHTSLKMHDIGVVSGTVSRWRGKQIVIGLVHSLALNRNGDEFRKKFGLVVFDEVDRSVPPATFAPVVPMFPSKYRIGCSATITRKDGLDVVFDKHIGEVHIQGVAGKGEIMNPTAIMVDYNHGSGVVPSFLKKMQRRGVLLSKLAKDPNRNAVIGLYIRKVYISGRRLVVLSDRVKHLQLLRELVHTKYGIPLKDMGLYVGAIPSGKGKFAKKKKVPEHEMHRVGRECKIIFATYQMFGIGTDIPTMAALLYATPQSEVVQTKGRIERGGVDGKQEPVVIDFYDSFYEETRRWAAERLRQYREDRMKIRRIR